MKPVIVILYCICILYSYLLLIFKNVNKYLQLDYSYSKKIIPIFVCEINLFFWDFLTLYAEKVSDLCAENKCSE